jgi:hypothetical protein
MGDRLGLADGLAAVHEQRSPTTVFSAAMAFTLTAFARSLRVARLLNDAVTGPFPGRSSA